MTKKSLAQREIQNVLEVGCGTGDVIARLSALKIGNEFVGVDVIDPKMNIDTVRDIPNLSFVRQTADTLPFEDASFDLVVASHLKSFWLFCVAVVSLLSHGFDDFRTILWSH